MDEVSNIEENIESSQKASVTTKKPKNQQDAMTHRLLIFLFFGILLCVFLNFWDTNSWKFLYETIDHTVDENGVNHYVLYSDKHKFTFEYCFGSYEVEMFESFKEEGEDGWFYTETVNKSDYVGKYLYTRKQEISEIFSDLKFDYELVYDEENEIYSHAIVYVSKFSDIGDSTVKQALRKLSKLVPSSRMFSQLNKDDYGRIEFYSADKHHKMWTKKLYLW